MKKYILGNFIALSCLLTGCVDNTDTNTNSSDVQDSSDAELAFFYQIVGVFQNGIGANEVRIGSISGDDQVVQSDDTVAVDWKQGLDIVDSYGDPVLSRLPNGNWTLTSWTTPDDPRGGGVMLYWEGACPIVDDAEVVAFTPSNATGCEAERVLQIGKTSQVFGADGGTYVFHSTQSGVHLAHLSDDLHMANQLAEMCVLSEPVENLEDLAWGDSMPVVTTTELLLSDTAIAQRQDGTWVLFVKGIEKDNDCQGRGGLCELCARGIYRTTSQDLVQWTELEKVVSQASIPEATQTVDGTVWLYYQDFSDTCSAQNLQLANVAPISGVYETEQSFQMSSATKVNFVDEEFETNSSLHYATNGNPVMLPDQAAQDALEACLE